MGKIRILRTGAGSPVSEAVIHALKAEGCEVVCADSDELSYGIKKHGGVVIPKASNSNFKSRIIDICAKQNINVVIPGVDEELPLFARMTIPDCKIIVSPLKTIETFDSKWKSNAWFLYNDIKTPLTNKHDFSNSIKKAEYGRGGKARTNDFVWQEYIEGTEYTIDAICDFNGKLLCGAVRERITVKGGSSIKARIVNKPEIWDDVKRICSLIEFRGPICLQCIENESGIYWIDINPRYGGGVALSIEAGVPMVWGLVKLLRGESVKVIDCYTRKLTMLRYWSEVFINE